MTSFRVDRFHGAVPGIAPRLLEGHKAQDATNAYIRDGDLVPLRDRSQVTTLAKAGTTKTLYRWADSNWFHWTSDVDVVESPLPSDTENRVYFTGDGAPKYTYAGIATSSGDGVYPSNAYDLGVPAPATAPDISISGTADNPDQDVGEDRAYVYTYVSSKGEEGPPSGPSGVKHWKPGQTVDVTSMDTGPGGNRNITSKRIYRTATGAEGTAFQFVAEIDVANTSYNDSVATDDLGELLPSAEWSPPPSSMTELVALPNGIVLGHDGNRLIPSEAYLPHAYPVDYRLQTAHKIVAKAVIGNAVLVATEGIPEVLTGAAPGALALDRGEIPYPCASKRSMVDMGYSAIYASPDGLVKFTTQGPAMLTAGLFTPEQWRAYAPSSMHAYRYDDFYVVFYDTGSSTGGMVVDPRGQWVMFIDLNPSAGYLEAKDGKFYLVLNDNEVHEFDPSGGTALTATWRSKTFITAKPVNMAAGFVEAAAYPVTFKLYADGQLRAMVSVANDEPFRLPGGYRADRWEVQIESTERVRRFEVAETMREIRSR